MSSCPPRISEQMWEKAREYRPKVEHLEPISVIPKAQTPFKVTAARCSWTLLGHVRPLKAKVMEPLGSSHRGGLLWVINHSPCYKGETQVANHLTGKKHPSTLVSQIFGDLSQPKWSTCSAGRGLASTVCDLMVCLRPLYPKWTAPQKQ